MSKVSVILGHPGDRSFNHAIAKIVLATLNRNDHEVVFHDLYKEGFDPLLLEEEIPEDATLPSDLAKYCSEIQFSEGIIVIHPNWWGQPPALLKGWIDRVLRPGVAYEFVEGDNGEGIPIGLLKAKAAIVFNTSNTPKEREMAAFGNPLQTIWENCIFRLCGISNFHRSNFSVIVTSTSQQRRKWLGEVRKITNRYFPKIV